MVTPSTPPGPDNEEARWNTGVDWLLNHRDSRDTNPLFFAFVDGLITEEELRAENTDDLDTDGFPRDLTEIINERRAATEKTSHP